MQTIRKAPFVGLALFAAACSGKAPMSPSSGSAGAPAMVTTVQSLKMGAFGPGVPDFALCLASSKDPGCFSAARLNTRAVGTPPGAPSGLNATSTGSSVTLTWGAAGSGDPLSNYIIEAGSTAGAADLANFSTNSTLTSFSQTGVGSGTYFVRVRAQNTGGTSAPSNEVVLTVGSVACAAVPNAPGGLAAAVSGSSVTLTWAAPVGGCVPTSYAIEAGSAPGLADLANASTGSTLTTFAASNVASGTYYVRVRARNLIGPGGPSNEVSLTVGSTVPPGFLGVNLILNGDAEAGPGSTTGDLVGAIPGWAPIGNFTVVRYGTAGGFPTLASIGPATRGQNFFAGGINNPGSSASQTINVSPLAALIDAGGVAFDLSGFVGGYVSEGDNAVLTATFGSASSTAISSRSIGPVSAPDRGGLTGLVLCATSGDLPAGTRIIYLTLDMHRTQGTYNDGYADNLSLVLSRRF